MTTAYHVKFRDGIVDGENVEPFDLVLPDLRESITHLGEAIVSTLFGSEPDITERVWTIPGTPAYFYNIRRGSDIIGQAKCTLKEQEDE